LLGVNYINISGAIIVSEDSKGGHVFDDFDKIVKEYSPDEVIAVKKQ
jgi:hypothetical protein